MHSVFFAVQWKRHCSDALLIQIKILHLWCYRPKEHTWFEEKCFHLDINPGKNSSASAEWIIQNLGGFLHSDDPQRNINYTHISGLDSSTEEHQRRSSVQRLSGQDAPLNSHQMTMSRNRWTCLSDLCSSVQPTSTITEWEQNPETRTDRQSLYSGWRLIIAAFIKLNNPVLSDIIPKQLCLHTHKYSKYRLPEQRLWVFVQSFSKYSRLVWERFGQQSKPHHNGFP